METDVAVAQPEPALAPEVVDRLEGVPRLRGAAPAALVVGKAREAVENAVEIGAHVKAEHLDVVRHVPYDGHVV
jgi:hypothetical protein